MRFVHIADVHFDRPFTVLSDKMDLGIKRRLEQREVFKKVIEYIATEKIPYLFIAGDLYEQEYIRLSTIEYINNLFKTIPQTQIFISPGNHDPFLKNSFYNNFNWNNNVTIFKDEIKRIELEEADIYGYGFSDFYCSNSNVEEIQIVNKNKLNILIVHGAIDSNKKIDVQYNPINSKKLKEKNFDYVALGHIHKKTEKNENNFIYPGSLISFGFDELGEHGIFDVEIKNKEKNKIKINFIKMDDRIFEEKIINISEINSEEELIEKINLINLNKKNIYKLILVGIRNIEINEDIICKLIQNKNVLKVEDKTETTYNIDKIANQKNLKGYFVKQILKNECLEKNDVSKIIEIGLKAFE